jgi:hypothetical protein
MKALIRLIAILTKLGNSPDLTTQAPFLLCFALLSSIVDNTDTAQARERRSTKRSIRLDFFFAGRPTATDGVSDIQTPSRKHSDHQVEHLGCIPKCLCK